MAQESKEAETDYCSADIGELGDELDEVTTEDIKKVETGMFCEQVYIYLGMFDPVPLVDLTQALIGPAVRQYPPLIAAFEGSPMDVGKLRDTATALSLGRIQSFSVDSTANIPPIDRAFGFSAEERLSAARLSVDEKLAIRLYSDYQNGIYSKVNDPFNVPERNLGSVYSSLLYLKIVFTALKKIPMTRVKYGYRGMNVARNTALRAKFDATIARLDASACTSVSTSSFSTNGVSLSPSSSSIRSSAANSTSSATRTPGLSTSSSSFFITPDEAFETGEYITLHALTSVSTDPKVAYEYGDDILYVFEDLIAKSVQQYSLHPEQEFIIVPPAFFKIVLVKAERNPETNRPFIMVVLHRIPSTASYLTSAPELTRCKIPDARATQFDIRQGPIAARSFISNPNFCDRLCKQISPKVVAPGQFRRANLAPLIADMIFVNCRRKLLPTMSVPDVSAYDELMSQPAVSAVSSAVSFGSFEGMRRKMMSNESLAYDEGPPSHSPPTSTTVPSEPAVRLASIPTANIDYGKYMSFSSEGDINKLCCPSDAGKTDDAVINGPSYDFVGYSLAANEIAELTPADFETSKRVCANLCTITEKYATNRADIRRQFVSSGIYFALTAALVAYGDEDEEICLRVLETVSVLAGDVENRDKFGAYSCHKIIELLVRHFKKTDICRAGCCALRNICFQNSAISKYCGCMFVTLMSTMFTWSPHMADESLLVSMTGCAAAVSMVDAVAKQVVDLDLHKNLLLLMRGNNRQPDICRNVCNIFLNIIIAGKLEALLDDKLDVKGVLVHVQSAHKSAKDIKDICEGLLKEFSETTRHKSCVIS
jgi:hypothetical protein